MLNAKTLKQHLTLDNISKLMQHFKAEPKQHGDLIMSKTVCHNGDSHKLYYYNNRKTFHCYTNCGSFDVFELVQKLKSVEFPQAFKWVMAFFGFSNRDAKDYFVSNVSDPLIEYQKQVEAPKIKKLKSYDPKILDTFDNIAYVNWLREGITPETLAKYHIKLDIPGEQIIIPEYDHNDRLIGVRSRHLNPDVVARGMKYAPINYHGTELKYPTGQILYGMNFNRPAINKFHKVILFEAEKSVMKLDSCLGDKNISLGINGSSLTDQQIALLKSMNVHEVMVALDKEFKHPFTKQERIYAEQIESEFYRLKKYFDLSIVWDSHDRLNYKDSPIDQGFKIFKTLVKERMFI